VTSALMSVGETREPESCDAMSQGEGRLLPAGSVLVRGLPVTSALVRARPVRVNPAPAGNGTL